ncbi:MAG: hypothetical protein HIU92_19820 [Proteobacteria bacterium]|nr:hypothetical protein [Pseudomonadota bacterium]
MRLSTTALAAAAFFASAAFTASFAQSTNGDIPPATTRSAFPGPTIQDGKVIPFSYSPTSGTMSGGMATNGGVQAGGPYRKAEIPQTAP